MASEAETISSRERRSRLHRSEQSGRVPALASFRYGDAWTNRPPSVMSALRHTVVPLPLRRSRWARPGAFDPPFWTPSSRPGALDRRVRGPEGHELQPDLRGNAESLDGVHEYLCPRPIIRTHRERSGGRRCRSPLPPFPVLAGRGRGPPASPRAGRVQGEKRRRQPTSGDGVGSLDVKRCGALPSKAQPKTHAERRPREHREVEPTLEVDSVVPGGDRAGSGKAPRRRRLDRWHAPRRPLGHARRVARRHRGRRTMVGVARGSAYATVK